MGNSASAPPPPPPPSAVITASKAMDYHRTGGLFTTTQRARLVRGAAQAPRPDDRGIGRLENIVVILTATIDVKLDLKAQYKRFGFFTEMNLTQQRDALARRKQYEFVISAWAQRSLLPIVLIENTGADLGSIARRVPPYRMASFDFLSYNDHDCGNAFEDIGKCEARSILHAVTNSRLISSSRHNVLRAVRARP
eukprot:4159562-Prymnesium_polylepis.2